MQGFRTPFVLALASLTLSQPVSAQLAACADRLMTSIMVEHGIPGMAAAVIGTDSVAFRATRGQAEIGTARAVTPSTPFQLSSTTRVFTGVLAMRLAAAERIELDAPVTRYLPDAPASWQRLTVLDLLGNVAGLTDPGVTDASSGETAVRAIFAASPTPAPGEDWSYNLAEYAVAQRVLERAGDASFEDLMQAEVFAPAGMTATRYWRSDRDDAPNAATGYYPDSTVTPRTYERREFDFPVFLSSAAGVAASLDDLIRFDRALRDGRFLPDSLRQRMWTDGRLAGGETVSYGLGWDMKTHAPGQRSAGHSGGYLTTFRSWPGSGLTVIVLTNGFLHPVNPDDLATAFAAVWDPGIVGLEAPACELAQLREARL